MNGNGKRPATVVGKKVKSGNGNTGGGGGGEVKYDKDGNVKKKRKQVCTFFLMWEEAIELI